MAAIPPETYGIAVSVVYSYAAVALSVSVMVESSVDLPTDGNPISTTRAFPDFITSKPSPGLELPFFSGSSSCRRSLASLARSRPMWYLPVSVASAQVHLLGRLVLLRAGHLIFHLLDLLRNTHLA